MTHIHSVTDSTRDERGLWAACSTMEQAALVTLTPFLTSFEPAVAAVYECGALAPTLRGSRVAEPDIGLSALFLKRALNDLRSLWLLLGSGYAASAASIGAAAIENALTVSVVAGHPSRAAEVLADAKGDVPWRPKQLAMLRAERWQADGTITSAADYEMAWREVYSAYKWLCKVKHPTLRSAIHEAGGTALTSPDYVVMAAPDLRPVDQSVKAIILTTVTNHVKAAVIHFATSRECVEDDAEFIRFRSRIGGVDALLHHAYNDAMGEALPFTIADEKIAREWHELRKLLDVDR